MIEYNIQYHTQYNIGGLIRIFSILIKTIADT